MSPIRTFSTLLLLAALVGCSRARAPAPLSQHDAQILAEKIASAKYRSILGAEPLHNTAPPKLVGDRWVWVCLRGVAMGDAEVTVSFDRDGSSPKVDCQVLSSAVHDRR